MYETYKYFLYIVTVDVSEITCNTLNENAASFHNNN